MIRVTDHHAARLLRLSPTRIMPAMGEELEAGAKAIAEDAAFSIRDGAISGSGHIPSLPGQPPNKDTGDLDESIHVGDVVELPNGIQTSVIADSDHAWIELGGSKMEPRPYMQPAVERGRSDITEALGGRFIREVNE